MGVVLMSKRELNRIDVLARLDGRRLTTSAAADLELRFPPCSAALCTGRRTPRQVILIFHVAREPDYIAARRA